MIKTIAVAALGLVLFTSGCFWQKGKQREIPPPYESSSSKADTIPSDVEDVPDAVPRDEPLSEYGNPESYTVYGETYQVLPSSAGYRERGYASWYGRKFHGRRTSSGEIYDMYQMTAAHKTLPLPTFVRVTNVENNREIVVRVNDRGPFHSDRIIDLSYAAAAKLGILDAGSAMVNVEAISGSSTLARNPNAPMGAPPASAPQTYPDVATSGYPNAAQQNAYPQGPSVTGGGYVPDVPAASPLPVPAAPPAVVDLPPLETSSPDSYGSIYDNPPEQISEPASIYDNPNDVYAQPQTDYNAGTYTEPQYAPAPAPAAPAYAPTAYSAPGGGLTPGTYLQTGAYGQAANAYAMAERLRNAGFDNVVVDSAQPDGLSRVHLGPYASNSGMQSDKRRLHTIGVSAFTIRR